MKKILLVLLAVFLLITSGCKQQTVTPVENPSSAYVVTDDKGRQVKISGKPMRIVSATYGTDEILAEVVDPGRIKAFSKWAGDPEITFITQEQADQVGNKVGENTEAIVALKPDLVFVSVATSDSLVKNLEDMGIPVYVAGSPKTVAAMRKKVLGVAAAAGENARGEALVAAMDKKLLKLESKLQAIPKDKEKIVMAFSFIGAIGRKDNLLDDIFQYAHVRNGAAEAGLDQGSNSLSKERIIAINPDVFLLPTWNFDSNNDVQKYAEQVAADPAFKNIKAVKNKRLEFVSDRYRYVASQHVTDSIEAVAKAVYPELFVKGE
ncbi:ABC transporter substrate-binding protein [Phascolarctobacterium sp.]